MGHIEHKKNINANKRLSVYIITLSDSRKESEDESGDYIKKELASAGHEISGYA